MAPISPPAWMQAGTYPARVDRLALSALMSYPGFSADEAIPTRIRQGVRPSYQNYQLKVRAAATPNMTVIVSAGTCYIDNHDLANYGCYICVNDADYTLTIAAAGGAGQYRKDTVVASVYDAETAGSTSEFRIEVIQGPYAASAGATVRGTLPNNAQVLADISIAPSQTTVSSGNISDARNYSVGLGGIVPISSGIDMSRPHPGQVRYRTDTDTFVYGKADGTTAVLLDSSGASGIGKSQYAFKTADTSRSNSVVTSADPHLQLPVVASATYIVEMFIAYVALDTIDMQFDYNAPSGATGIMSPWGPDQSAGSGSTTTTIRTVADASVTSSRAVGGSDGSIILSGRPVGLLTTAGSAGTFSFDWAQSTSSATQVTVKSGSWMKLTRVA